MYLVPVQTLGVPPSVFQAKGQSIANCFFGIQAPPCSVFKLAAFLWVGSKSVLVEISCCFCSLDFHCAETEKGVRNKCTMCLADLHIREYS